MRKKVLSVLSLVLVLIVFGFFRFLDVDAKGTSKPNTVSNTALDVPTRADTTVRKTIDHEAAFLVTSPDNEGDSVEAVEVLATVSEPKAEATSVVETAVVDKTPPSIELYGETYEILTDEKFSLYIDEARNLGAGFYGIPFSDVFAMVKNGEVLFQMSTGIKGAPVENVELLMALVEKSGDLNGVGSIVEDIRKVVETGETISVEGPDYTGYSVSLQEGWVIVSF